MTDTEEKNTDLTFSPSSNRRNSEAHALREVREQLKKDLLRYQGNQVGAYWGVEKWAMANEVTLNQVGYRIWPGLSVVGIGDI